MSRFRLVLRLPPATIRDAQTGDESRAHVVSTAEMRSSSPDPYTERDARGLYRLPSNPDLYT